MSMQTGHHEFMQQLLSLWFELFNNTSAQSFVNKSRPSNLSAVLILMLKYQENTLKLMCLKGNHMLKASIYQLKNSNQSFHISHNLTRPESLLDFLESQIHIFVYYDVSLQSQTKVSENQTTRKVEFLLLLDPLSTPHQPSTNVAANGTGQGLTVRALAAMKRYIIWIFVYMPHITIYQYKQYSLIHCRFCPLIGHTTILIVSSK